MAKILSAELGLENKLSDLGAFDPILDLDSNYYVNIKRLQNTKTPEFKESYRKIDQYFSDLGLLLSSSIKQWDKPFSAAYKKFNFPEVNEIGLGFAKGSHGNAFGEKLRAKVISDAKEIIDFGFNKPELFHLIGLFEDNVGADRLSDMIARIILEDIEAYTLRIYAECKINQQEFPDYEFDNQGFFINPYKITKTKKTRVLLVPMDIIHELPIAYEWEDINTVYMMNEEIKDEFNRAVGSSWRDLELKEKKNFLKKKVFTNIEIIEGLVEKYKRMSIPAYDFTNDSVGDYYIPRMLNNMLKDEPSEHIDKPLDSFSIALFICEKYKNFIENKKGYELFYDENGKTRKEHIMQRAFYLAADAYSEAYNLDISPEANGGRGPVDFKMSRGTDKTIVEVKLTTNSQVVHGYEVQIEEYAKAENTDNKIYMIIDNGGPKTRLKAVQDIHSEKVKTGEKVPTLFIISAIPKESASKYEPNC